MRNPYGIKKTETKNQDTRQAPSPLTQKPTPNSAPSATDVKMKIEKMLRARRLKKQRKNSTPWLSLLSLSIVFVALGFYVNTPDGLKLWSHLPIEVHWLGQVFAKDKADGKKAAEAADKEPKSQVKSAETGPKETSEKAATDSPPSEEEMNYFSKLRERKQELDRREQELARLEEELQKQKIEIEGRIRKLASVRDEISKLLSERVKVDQERVGKLVEFYSNMKPQQAASIIEKLDEDLAVEVLGQMKKKNAAEIINLLQADKARKLSEKFAGYAKR